MSATSSLAYLPTELYEAILDQIDPTELQKVTLALRLALPRSPVPLHQLFKHVRINSRPQVPKFWQRLEVSKKADGDRAAANWVQSFELGTFDVDADVLYKYVQVFHNPIPYSSGLLIKHVELQRNPAHTRHSISASKHRDDFCT